MRSTLEREEQQTDTEITLGMSSLLGIFFGLVLICGVFFGLGYSLGRGNSASHPAAATTTAAPTENASAAAPHKPKPSADEDQGAQDESSADTAPTPRHSAGDDGSSVTVPSDDAPRRVASTPAPALKPQPAATPKPTPAAPAPAASVPAADTSATTPALTRAAGPVTTPATAAPQAAGSPVMVQIAAVTRQEDADVLVSALRRRGYAVTVRNEPQDKLLHVQTGPFASRDDARNMRAKLLSDGYNAIIKP